MPIRVQEIFRSDLDPNSDYWWASDKLDKLNYNFGLLSLGGAPGPLGPQGNDGPTGERGFQGLVGFKGPDGHQGPTGLDGDSPWKIISGEDNDTLIPLFQNNGLAEYSAIPIIIGARNSMQVPNGNDPFGYHDPLDFESSVVTLYAEQNKINLSFSLNNSDVGYRINDPAGLTNIVDFGNLPADPNIAGYLHVNNILDQTEYNLQYLDDQNIFQNLLSINENDLISFSTNSIFNQPAIVNSLKYNLNAGIGKVLVSTNTDGDVVWKNQVEVFSALPEGSVISLRREDFNNNNFHINDAGSLSEDQSNELNIIYGRGREEGPFRGWYLANGKTWEFDNGLVSHLVPNLNSFNYAIDSGLAGTGEIGGTAGDDTTIIIGGGDTQVDALYSNPNTNYTVDLTLNSSDDILDVDSVTGSSATLHKNVNIVKLNENNLYWRTNPGGQPSTLTISLSVPGDSSGDACGNPQQSYQITNISGVSEWIDTSNSLTGSTLYASVNGSPGSIAVANKWYATGGVARFWNGSSFTSISSCPIVSSVNLRYDLDVTNLNGNVVSTGTFEIDGTDYATATTLVDSNNNNANSGWYKVSGDVNGLRRYWNGTQFLGDSISEEYVHQKTNLQLSNKLGNSSCTMYNAITPDFIYYATDNVATGPVSTELRRIWQEDGIVYVHYNWTGSSNGQHPLVKVYSQNRPGSTSPYASIIEAGFSQSTVYYSTILQTSKLIKPITCNDNITGNTGINTIDWNNGNQPTVDGTGGVINIYTQAGRTLKLTATNSNESHWAIADVIITGPGNSTTTLSVSLEGDVGTNNVSRTDTDTVTLSPGEYTWTWDISNMTNSSIINLTFD